MPELDDTRLLLKAEQRRQDHDPPLFGKLTAVAVMRTQDNGLIAASFCGKKRLQKCIEAARDESTAPKFQLFYITMSATGTLHIAADVFQELALCYDIPVAFINSVLDYGGEPRYTAFGSRPPRAEKIQVFWYTLPIRLALDCTTEAGGEQLVADLTRDCTTNHHGEHSDANPGSDYLHLDTQKTDIGQFDLAVFCRHNLLEKTTAVICVYLCSGLLESAEVTKQRVLHALDDGGMGMIDRNPLWVNIVYISMAVHFWKVTFEYVASELNSDEKEVAHMLVNQAQLRVVEDTTSAKYKKLHTMDAHCQRYKMELATISAVIVGMMREHKVMSEQLKLDVHEAQRVGSAFKQQLAETTALTMAQEDMERRIRNLLTVNNSYSIPSKLQMTGNRSRMAKHSKRSQSPTKTRSNKRRRTAE
ncbi:hypothetical protein BZA05DRAFT_211371 [Tricharina praecox]|uniref:uncharacterized protein n=1 Tax=Tricharina praecox TaxID=43433 RepID=UPI00222073F6|nr:uncharacterized protein BZA05DRAFT_211371 [Tricharina praecox]KAI5841695.1 hypothetical protein BZA05DRAFT_211371 [Tricharina praecox]